MRRRVVWIALCILAFAALGTAFLRPGGPLARPGVPAPPPQGEPDPPNRAETDIPGETVDPTLPRAMAEGNRPLPYRMEGGVKVFHLTARRVQWEVTPGRWVEAWTYNGTVPGPLIRVRERDRVRIVFRNELPEPTAVHWHGQTVPWGQDGVPGLTQKAVQPGETFVYEFTAGPRGTHWYHTHFNTSTQITSGLYGAFIVDPPAGEAAPRYDREYVVMIGDAGRLGLTLNGHGYPRTLPMTVRRGERVLVRMIHAGVAPHPMHMHGHVIRMVAKNGARLKDPIEADTINISPGESYDFDFVANNPGAWVFHCHIPAHAEGPTGMFGLTMEVRYEDVPGLPPHGAAASHDGHH